MKRKPMRLTLRQSIASRIAAERAIDAARKGKPWGCK
jgi:hypothetical protein